MGNFVSATCHSCNSALAVGYQDSTRFWTAAIDMITNVQLARLEKCRLAGHSCASRMVHSRTARRKPLYPFLCGYIAGGLLCGKKCRRKYITVPSAADVAAA